MSYRRKCGDSRKLNRLKRSHSYFVYNHKNYLKRFYLSGKRKFCKKATNKIVRHYCDLSSRDKSYYRKLYDYWWTLF